MACEHVDGGVICGLPDGFGEAYVNGRLWRWEFVDSPGGGPGFLGKRGDLLANQNPPRAVWDAFEKWHREFRCRQGVFRLARGISRAAQAFAERYPKLIARDEVAR